MGQTALSAVRDLQKFGAPLTMQIRAPEAPRPPLESGAPNFCRFRAKERAIWPVGRAGTATSQAGCSGPGHF
eukprot:11736701-Alexandrium_andersonii.AAC.1